MAQLDSLRLHVKVTLGPQGVEKVQLAPHSEGFLLSFEGADAPLIKQQVSNWFTSYMQGEQVIFPLDLSRRSPFTQKVLQEMQKIPFGKAYSYMQLAKLAGSPKAARAVGNICRDNPFPLLIPCHRITSSSGLGGFAYGLDMKRQLLDFESAHKLFRDRSLLRSQDDLPS